MIPADVADRLRAHADAVVAAASVPAADREELVEEVFGHLVERWRALVDEGMEAAAAADGAIGDFGTAERIGRDLMRTYHGRLWASTIGLLLPAVRADGHRPTVAWWLGLSLWVYLVLSLALGWTSVLTHPPVRAALIALVGLPYVALLAIAATALRRGQRWALTVAIIVNLGSVLLGIAHMASTPGLISLNVFASGVLLVAALWGAPRLTAWVRDSRPIPERLELGVLVLTIAGLVTPAAAGALPDPTQAGAADLHITAAMNCDEEARSGTVTVELRWDRVDLLPGGIANLNGYGDMLVLELHPDLAAPHGYPFLTDAATGDAVAEPNVFPPAGDLLVQRTGLTGPAMVGIEPGRLQAGHTYRLTWDFDIWEGTTIGSLQAGVEYWHLDRWRREALLDCSGRVMWLTDPPNA